MGDGDTRVAVVGYGYWGAKHVRVFDGIPGVGVTVVDTRAERLAQARVSHAAVSTTSRLEDVLDRVDAVVVATPPATHARVAMQALMAGRHVLVEKPMATSSHHASVLVAAAARRDCVLMAGHTFEYNPAVRALKSIVDSGSLGRILYIDTARLSLGRYQTDVNVIWDLAPHDLSIISYLMGETPRVVGTWTRQNVAVGQADLAYLQLRLDSGASAFVHVSWLDPCKIRRVTVVGDRKMAVYDDLSDSERIRVYDIGVDPTAADAPDDPEHAMPVTYRAGDIVSPYVAFQEPLLVQDTHFVDCVRNGRRPDTPGERGLEIVRLLEQTDVDGAHPSSAPLAVADALPGGPGLPVDAEDVS